MADLDDDYIAKVEDVLEVYARPYDSQQPVICLNEKPVTLRADVRPPRRPSRDEKRGAAISPSRRPIARPSSRTSRLQSDREIPAGRDHPLGHTTSTSTAASR